MPKYYFIADTHTTPVNVDGTLIHAGDYVDSSTLVADKVLATKSNHDENNPYLFTFKVLNKSTVLLQVGTEPDGIFGNPLADHTVYYYGENRVTDYQSKKKQVRQKNWFQLTQLDSVVRLFVKHNFTNVLLLTHIPPHPQACLYRGQPIHYDMLPFFTCGCADEWIKQTLEEYPTLSITVLCGHTHEQKYAQIADHYRVFTGEANRLYTLDTEAMCLYYDNPYGTMVVPLF